MADIDSSWPPLPAPLGVTAPILTAPTAVPSIVAPVAEPLAVSSASLPLLSSPLPSLTSPMSSQPPSRVAATPLFASPSTTRAFLYSPSVGISPSSLQGSSQAGADSILQELRSSMVYCMERFRAQDEHIVLLTRQYESLVTSLNSVIEVQRQEIQHLRTLEQKMSEDLAHLRAQFQEHSHDFPLPEPDPQVREQIATIQTEVQRHSEWVEVARKAPSHAATVSETIAESDRRTQRSLNLRIRGIEKSDSATPLQQAIEFATQTMGVTDHGIVSAYRAGGDPARPQPLIVRFRNAETRLAVLRRRRRLRESPQIHLDEDLTPLQWQDYRALLPQRHAARQEGLWAVIRDGRLITRPLRTTRPDAGGGTG